MLWRIIVAGGLGTGARYLVGVWALERLGSAFPFGTLIVNVIGCFVLGIVAQTAAASGWSPELRGPIVVGFLGGFTTYSSFNQETLGLLSTGAAGAAILNIALTLVGGLAAGWLGHAVARQLVA